MALTRQDAELGRDIWTVNLSTGVSTRVSSDPANEDDAAWTDDNGTLQYELALQLGELKKGGYQDLGATRLPQTAGTPTGAAGNVRVVTSPPGAAVYQLIGFTPDVRVENLDVREPAELLVYLAGYEPQRVTLTEGTYKLEDGRLVADLEIALKGK